MYSFKPEQPMGLMDFVKAAKAQVKEVTPDELEQLRAEKSDLLLVDVRESSEFEQGHIEGALLVPRGILEAAADPGYPMHVEALSSTRERPVAVYCASGGRSAMAAAVLQMMGFNEVYSMAGGFGEWQKSGKPVHKEARYV